MPDFLLCSSVKEASIALTLSFGPLGFLILCDGYASFFILEILFCFVVSRCLVDLVVS